MRILATTLTLLLFCTPALCKETHGLAMHGQPKYAADFTHFDYVNPDAPKGGSLKLHAIGSFDSLNPFVSKGTPAAGMPFIGQGLIYEPLMVGSYDEPFSMYCLLCKSADITDDGGSITFTIRNAAKWSDGKKLTAQDVEWSFNTLMEKGSPFFKSYYGGIKSAKASGNKVVFTFKDSTNAELPLIIGQMPVLPMHSYLVDKSLSTPIGSGAYKVAKVEAGRSVVYEKDPNWWGANLAPNKGRYNFDKITYDYYRDDSVALEAFLAGAYDARIENSAQNWASGYNKSLVESGQIIKEEIRHKRPQGLSGFIYNTRRSVFSDIETRRALAMAFDFNWENKTIAHGAYKRSPSYFSNSELGAASNDDIPQFDLRKAARALSANGWRVSSGGIREKDGQKLEFEILLNSPAIERWATPFIANLKKIGVDARVRTVDSATYQSRLNNFDFDMIFETIAQSNSPGNEQLDFWSSGAANVDGSRNYAGIKSDEIDEVVQKIITAKSRQELISQTRDLDRLLTSGVYMINGWHLDHWRIAWWSNKIKHPDNLSPLTPAISDTWWSD